MQRGTMGAPDQDTGLALGVWPQLGIVWPELALERFCRPREIDRGLGQVGGCTLCPSPVFNASKYSTLLETLTQTCFILGMSKCRENRQPCLFPSAVRPKFPRLGSAMVLKGCRLAAEPSHFLTHPHIKAHYSSTNEQLAQLSWSGAFVDVLIGWNCAACCASRQPGFLQPGRRSRVPPAHHNPSWTVLINYVIK